MPIRPAFTTPISERTSTADSLVGSIAASLNLPVEDGAAALLWTKRDGISAQMVSKWPTLQFQIQRIASLTDRLAEDARKVMVSTNKTLDTPVPNLVLARAAMMLATEGAGIAAGFLLDAYEGSLPESYRDDQEARINILMPYWEGISPAVAGQLEDFPCVYSALARLIAIDRREFRFQLDIGKSTVRDLCLGKMKWGDKSIDWLMRQMEERAEELKPILRCDEAYIAEARPSLIGLAWQLWPDMQSYLEEHAHWIQETPEGDPRKSWKDGWEGFDPSLSPEGFVDDEEKDDLDGDL